MRRNLLVRTSVRQSLVVAVLVALGSPLAAQGEDFFAGEAMSDIQRYRVYPHVDRGLQEYGKQHYRAAAESFARALELAPHSVRIRLALARAYAGDGRIEEAEQTLLAVAGRDKEAATTLFNLRGIRLGQGAPLSPNTLAGWLKDCQPAWCDRYAALVVPYLLNHGQAAAARDMISDFRTRGRGSEPRAALLLEAAVAERQRDWSGARKMFQAAAAIRPLADSETYRYGLALLNDGDFEGASRLLDGNLAGNAERQRLAREFIQRAIAAKRPKLAEEQLVRLHAAGTLTSAEQVQWLRLLAATGQHAEAQRQLAELARCPGGKAGTACRPAPPAGIDEQEWLSLAGGLGRIDLLEKMSPASETGKHRRQRFLADHYLKHGQYARLIGLFRSPPPDRGLALSLALAYQRTGDRPAAAAQLESAFRRWRQWADLDQASYLFVAVGMPERAHEILASALPFPAGKQGEALLQRLLEIYQAVPRLASAERLEALASQRASPPQREALADLWRRQGRCDRSLALLENAKPGGRGLLVLADCHRPTRPGLATHYYEEALPYAPELATRSLAYLYAETGNPAAALARWRALPTATLDRRDRMAAAEAALAAGELAQARAWWSEAGPEDAEWHRLGGRLEEKEGHQQAALAHWREAFKLAPDGASAYAMGRLSSALGHADEAMAYYREAFRLAPEEEYRLALGFALVRERPAEAAGLLAQSQRQGAERFPIAEQLGYLQIRLGDNEAARQNLAVAVDLADDYLAQLPADEAADRRFALRRSREGLDRRWSLGFSSWVASSGVPGELQAGQPLARGTPRHYAELNAEVRLGKEPVDNFRFLALTARASAQGSSHDTYPGGQSLFGLGLRWKPFSAWNLYLAGEEQFAPDGPGHNDFMLRASASLFDQGSHRGDWHAGGHGWFQQDLYLDGAKWVDSGRYDVLARYTFGYNLKLATESASTIYPYAFIQAEKRSDGKDSRWGAGVAHRLWGDDDRYSAFRHSYNLKLEYQQVIHSDLARSSGWFLKFEGNW